MTLEQAETLALETLKQVMEEKISPGNIEVRTAIAAVAFTLPSLPPWVRGWWHAIATVVTAQSPVEFATHMPRHMRFAGCGGDDRKELPPVRQGGRGGHPSTAGIKVPTAALTPSRLLQPPLSPFIHAGSRGRVSHMQNKPILKGAGNKRNSASAA